VTALYRPSETVRDRLLAAAGRERATHPGTWRRRAIVSAVLAVGWIGAMMVGLGLRPDWRELPGGSLAGTIGALVGIAGIVSTVALARGRAMVGASTESLSGVVWGAPLALLLLVAALDPRGPSTVEVSGWWHILTRSLTCDLLIVTIGAPLVVLGLMLWRGLTVARPLLTGAGLGLGAATWAHVLMRVHCGLGGVGHAILGHVVAAIPLMVLGAWGMRVIAHRARSSFG
jgi:hypothetical protein